ncbi:mitochondrial amino-acid acetyltransferase [Phellopilus nigrolimitatus]|nr:mitochondrial amino-acid acetyltransferase [Phellopilus nigrolimitatus]
MFGPARFCLPATSGAAKQRVPHVLTSSFATVRNTRPPSLPEPDEPADISSNDFILSILRANPSLRDTKSYLQSFGPRVRPPQQSEAQLPDLVLPSLHTSTNALTSTQEPEIVHPLATSILNPVFRRTALVKIQGPFTERQLESVARGMVYLEKLGLTSVIVVELDNWVKGEPGEKANAIEETMRVVTALERQGARARPVLQSVVRLGPKPGDYDDDQKNNNNISIPEAHTLPHDLSSIRSALRAGEIPVLPPIALDSFCRSVRIRSNDVLGALARGMVEAAHTSNAEANAPDDIDLTPMRLMIINKEGGVPSYARNGFPHLLVNLTAEYSHINGTFHSSENLALAHTCLSYMPPSSSAIMVSHRSPKSLIGNLITNKPELSSSLPHALLQGNGKLTPHTPTILRRGLPVRVVNRAADLDREKLTTLLEGSFRRTLDADAYFRRLDERLDFAIIAGDYAGAAIVTNEPPCVSSASGPASEPIAYLDKFAVRPENQGDGTVDFLWVALHDESYGLGLSFAANPNGGKEGRGEGRDLRSTGHLRIGKWVMFWCDAEKRLKIEEGRRGYAGLSKVEEWEQGRLAVWANSIADIPSSWSA